MYRCNSTARPLTGRGRISAARWWVAVVLALGAQNVAAQVPADAVFSGFKPNGDFLFELAGETLKHAEIYLSDRAASYLVLAPELADPVLISPRTHSVEMVSIMKVVKRDDGAIDLLPDATFNNLGAFRIDGQTIVFQVKGQTAKLKAKPPLLGELDSETLRSYKPEYGRLADTYQPEAKDVESLRAQREDVFVLVYFGTWCPVCGRQVPRIMKVDEELEDSMIYFEYYGLPQPMTADPRTKSDGVHGVPTAIVYVDGKEVGRLSGDDLNAPERVIFRMIEGKGAKR